MRQRRNKMEEKEAGLDKILGWIQEAAIRIFIIVITLDVIIWTIRIGRDGINALLR